MAPRWLRWLTYAHDPEAHAKLAEISERLAHLAAVQTPTPTTPRRTAMTLDCGHTADSWATTSDGCSECPDCYAFRVRWKAGDLLFSTARRDDGWVINGRAGAVAGPYPDATEAERLCRMLNTMAGVPRS